MTPEEPETPSPRDPETGPDASRDPGAPPPPPDEKIEVEAEPFDPARGGPRKTVDMPPPPPPAGGGPGGGRGYPAGAGSAERGPNTAWAMACHLTALFDFGVSLLLYGFIVPLVIWLVKRDEDPEVDYHGKESLNFQLNVLFWYLVSIPLSLCLIGIPILFLLPIAKIVLCVIAAVRTAEGERFRYPYIYRVIQ